MNIVFLRSNPVNPDSRVEKEVNSLLKAGHKLTVLAWDRERDHKPERAILKMDNGDAEIVRVGIAAEFGGGMKKNLMPLLKFQSFLKRWLTCHKDEYDVIHACDFDTAFTAIKAARKCHKKFVYDIFDYYVHSFNVPAAIKTLIERSDRKIINNADAVIICTEQRKEQIAGTMPKNLFVIHNSPAKVNVPQTNKQHNRVKVVYVGILAGGRFLKEIAEVIAKRNDCEFHIGGFGQLEDYFKNMSAKYSSIFFYGKLKYSDTLKLESECDIMSAVYNPQIRNHYYAAPNKFYESLMLGKPVIMAKNTGMANIVEENDIGVCIDYTAESFDQALDKIISRKNEWDSISSRMKSIYEKNYSWDEMEKRLIRLYDYI